MVCVERFTHLRQPECIAKAWKLAYLGCTLKEASESMGISPTAFTKYFPMQKDRIMKCRNGYDDRFDAYYEKEVQILEQRDKVYAPASMGKTREWVSPPTRTADIVQWYYETDRPLLNSQQVKELEYVMGNLHRRNANTRQPSEADLSMIAQIKAVLHWDRDRKKSRLHSC